MRFYRISEQRVRRVVNSPKRIEEGIAPKTVAMMQPISVMHTTEIVPSEAEQSRGTQLYCGKSRNSHKETWNQELWVMIQDKGSIRKVISAWRYPGMTKPGTSLPEEILREIRAGVVISQRSVEDKEAVREKMRGALHKWRRTLRG